MSKPVLLRCWSTLVVSLMVLVFVGYWFVYNIIAKPAFPAAVVFNIVFILALWSYLAASLTNPGTPTCAEWQMWARLEPRNLMPEASQASQAPRCWIPGSASFCSKCAIWRPERSHHCKSLGMCVLRMDHFCPWIGNCVGFRNHKQFVLMNFYITLASFIGLWTLREPTASKALSGAFFASASDEHEHSGFFRTSLSIAVLICLTFTLITLMLFTQGIYDAALNVTRIESKYKDPNPYLLATTWENIKQLFGSCKWLLLPVQRTGGDCVGTVFPYKTIEGNTPKSYGAMDSTTASAAVL